MKTDKEIALELIDTLEELYYRNLLYEAILRHSLGSSSMWRQRFDEMLKLGLHREDIRQDFLPIRQQVLDAPDLTSAVREMLEGLERIDPRDSENH